MQAFQDTARVQILNNGVYFYEPDILMSYYLFSGEVRIDIKLKYEMPGFGILIAENNDESVYEADHKYLFHLGVNQFDCFEKHLSQQSTSTSRTNIVSPDIDKVYNLRFVMKHRRGVFYTVTYDTKGQEKLTEIGAAPLKRRFTEYYIGFYSAAGNTIEDVSFLQGIPDRWHVSIANVHGGRISFWEDGFMFENCIHDAELEQKELVLPKGKYWFNYQTEKVNDIFDIEGFIYPSTVPTPTRDTTDKNYLVKRAAFDERYLEDQGKDLVENRTVTAVNDSVNSVTGTFELFRDTSVVVSFKGMSGKVSYINIRDIEDGEFTETHDKPVVLDGSWLDVILTDKEGNICLKNIRWEGIVYRTPQWKDMSQPCPYGLVVTKTDRLTTSGAAVIEGEWYDYFYDVETSVLTTNRKGDNLVARKNITLTAEDNNTLRLFFNVKADMANLILTYTDGTEININIQKTFKTLVKSYIEGPIIVTDETDTTPFELSASFREIVEPEHYHIDLFNKAALELKLSYHTSTSWQQVNAYGIPKGATIDLTKNNIEDFATSYTKIPSQYITIMNDIVTLSQSIREAYEYIAVRYQRTDVYNYWFTVYEREIFDGSEEVLLLNYDVNETGQGITVWGIPEESDLLLDHLFRVPNEDMVDTIDLCARRYDMLSPDLYTVKPKDSYIKMKSTVRNQYAFYIVDYMKKNSYTVNYDNSSGNYEVDIVSDEVVMHVHYEMDEDGVSSRRIRTDIEPTENKFIILRRQEGAFDDEDISS